MLYLTASGAEEFSGCVYKSIGDPDFITAVFGLTHPPAAAKECITVDTLPDGRWRIKLTPVAISLWLQGWLRSPPDISDLSLNSLKPEGTCPPEPFIAPSHVQRFHLSAQGFMQYVYARCHHINLANADVPFSLAPERMPALPPTATPTAPLDFNQNDWALIRSLLRCIDHLAYPPPDAAGLWTIGGQLATATETWISALPRISPLSPSQRALLRGIEQALFIFFRAKLGVLPSKTL